MSAAKEDRPEVRGDAMLADESSVASLTANRSTSGVVLASLALLPDRALLDEEALASALGVTKRTVRRMVARFELPPPVSFAGRSMWQAQKVLGWFEERAERLAREAQRGARRFSEGA